MKHLDVWFYDRDQFIYLSISRFPALVNALVSRIDGHSTHGYRMFVYNCIDYMTDPDALFARFYDQPNA